MSDYVNIFALVEGQTEEIFIKKVLQPYFINRQIYITPIRLSKPGEKGGDVKFSRAINDIRRHLKQRSDTYVTLLIDYYGLKEWPGLENARGKAEPSEIAAEINNATRIKVKEELPDVDSERRFLPNIAVHEFETYLFSDSGILSTVLGVEKSSVDEILATFRDPEKINNSVETAPSKRIEKMNNRFKKTVTGIKIAESIGVQTMREKCSVFNNWITELESLIEA
ncbi:MAG: DUF4276 family protein [Spirochaetales bacterium]|nr:DUF4276 family protein [Spirochaetales bacterium]